MHCLLSPPLCHDGGCSRVSRRFLWRKIRKLVAVPVLAAIRFGDNVEKIENQENYSQSVISVLKLGFTGLSTTF